MVCTGSYRGAANTARIPLPTTLATATHTKGHTMCARVTCENCSKPTWAGCGEHIEDALQGVAVPDRCACER